MLGQIGGNSQELKSLIDLVSDPKAVKKALEELAEQEKAVKEASEAFGDLDARAQGLAKAEAELDRRMEELKKLDAEVEAKQKQVTADLKQIKHRENVLRDEQAALEEAKAKYLSEKEEAAKAIERQAKGHADTMAAQEAAFKKKKEDAAAIIIQAAKQITG